MVLSSDSRPRLATIRTEDAVGTVLCHDITRIVPGESKGPVFRKGHVVTAGDVPVLLAVGKEHLYVYEPQPGLVHEDDAARRIAAAAMGNGLTLTEPKEGRINAVAAVRGLLTVDVERLLAINSLGEVSLATLHTLQEVQAGQAVAGTRVVPLLADEKQVEAVERICAPVTDAADSTDTTDDGNGAARPIVEVRPFRAACVGLVTTGSEIYHGRIADKFGPVLHKKFEHLGSCILGQTLTPDNGDLTRDAILNFIRKGADMVVVTGGMSVDPDDRTPASIRAAGGVVESYGAPTFPGAMFLLAHVGDVPVLGLPGCVMYHKASIFDLIVPRLLAGVDVSAADIAALGHGGYCAGCGECRYPLCPFGKN